MTHSLNLSPYTAEVAQGTISCNGAPIITIAPMAWETLERIAVLLNAAYLKGVEDANARLQAAIGVLKTESAPQPPIVVPWSDLTDSAKDSIRADYPYSKWTEAELAAHTWTKPPCIIGMRLWVPCAATSGPSLTSSEPARILLNIGDAPNPPQSAPLTVKP